MFWPLKIANCEIPTYLVPIQPVWAMHLFDKRLAEGDLLGAIAEKYFHLPCSCMMPNKGRFELIDSLVEEYRPQGIVDLIWQACHTYNVEAALLKEHVEKKHGLPFLKIETDYSPSDTEQIRLRVEAFISMAAER